ncbi:cupin domain-containing protein [Embleya sp. NBC_00896]|uniref:cupin domain-containing protein n=1 Tax=Embleya sp. NBC_00896 TaxID=2975961 RepID=UPI002F90EFC1|nr:cupin domain-containing protein [Embleya sp. NBC_00896]
MPANNIDPTNLSNLTDLTDPNSPILVRTHDAEVVQDGPTSLITLLADTPGLTANLATFAKGSPGAPAHFHTRASEMFHVLEGTMRILLGEEIVTLETGDFLVVPPTVPHAFAPAPDTEAKMLVVFTPGMDRFDYYRLLERVHKGEADIAELRATSERFDNHYVDSPVWRRTLTGA